MSHLDVKCTDWTNAPTSSDGKPINVGFRIGVERISEIITSECSAVIRVAVTFYWTDPRLVGWNVTSRLPPNLWGPIFVLVNQYGTDLNVFDEVFALVDRATGRMKRGVVYLGKIENPMDLTNFPFDMDTLDFNFHTTSHWKCLDGSQENMDAFGRTYNVYAISSLEEGASKDDPFCRLEDENSGKVQEWTIHGYTYNIDTQNQITGVGSDFIKFSILLERKTGYYVWKTLFPLYLIMTLNLTVYAFPPDELEARLNHCTVLVLTSFATLFVMNGELPKVDYLTSIDKVVILTLFLNVLSAVEAVIVFKWKATISWLYQWDERFAYILAIAFIIVNVMVILPTIKRKEADKQSVMSSLNYKEFQITARK